MRAAPRPLGLYIHIPYCTRLCHYCDFVKTARFSASDPAQYLDTIAAFARSWRRALESENPKNPQRLSSLFFGGGTPSLLKAEYGPLIAQLSPWLEPQAEVTLEANPEHVHLESLLLWRKAGINRLSLGVQSFQGEGLRQLTRHHSPKEAQEAALMARQVFDNVGVDLIYGWQGQTLAQWEADLQIALRLGIQHLSLYNLTYEGQTPLARRHRRGLLPALSDETLEAFYQLACDLLAHQGWEHEEVSNWHRKGFASRHNSLYWQSHSYIGLGNGAHSYLDGAASLPQQHWGLRWSQSPHLSFLQKGRQGLAADPEALVDLLALPGLTLEEGRQAEDWIMEVVSSGLRSRKGISVEDIRARTGFDWKPRAAVQHGLSQGQLILEDNGQLLLIPKEWLRETSWSLEVALSFVR